MNDIGLFVRGWQMLGLIALIGAALWLPAGAAPESGSPAPSRESNPVPNHASIPFSPAALETDSSVGSFWRIEAARSLRLNSHYIAGPAEGQDRDAWLGALREYRRQVRAGETHGFIELNGTVGWIRLSLPLMRALDLRPGDVVHYTVDARHLEGNGRFAFTFDLQDRVNDATFIDWTGVNAAIDWPRDGQWHRIEADVTVPAFDVKKFKLLPILGLDPKVKDPQGHMEVRAIDLRLKDARRMKALAQAVPKLSTALDRSLYDRAWPMTGVFTCHFSFLYDHSLIDPQTGQYRLKEFLADGRREFGGYDALILWQAYPRLGFDDRSQFDVYQDLPGGLAGVADLVRQAHAAGVKVFTNYNPWDTGTRRTGKDDEDLLADLVKETGVDGLFLDTMSGAPESLRRKLEEVNPAIAIAPESSPSILQLAQCNASQAQWLIDPIPPGLLLLKWIEPRHMQWQINRWNQDRSGEVRKAFFNGSGMLIWENIFGTYNPWSARDRRMWRRAANILHAFAPLFASEAWDPFYPTLSPTLHANRWPGARATVYTLVKDDTSIWQGFRVDAMRTPLLEVPYQAGVDYYDLWNGRPMEAERIGDKVRLSGMIDRTSRLGCVLAIERAKADGEFRDFLERQRQEALRGVPSDDPRNAVRSVIDPEPVSPTRPAPASQSPRGMVYVPGGTRHFHIEHRRGEFGCYPDPGTPADLWEEFLWGFEFSATLIHEIGPLAIAPYHIDQAEVTNAEFKRFLEATGYRPLHPENFLKHWPEGKMPAALADHPVVYVDIEDARAYAKWVGKRLPTEYEWQLAAQGTDGRLWPWGNVFDATKVNNTGHTLPVRALEGGRSPYGCYQMAGNVWEMTESVRDDGHTRFMLMRGGSYYKAEGSVWYVPGGPQRCDSHTKFILLRPALDRCATVGFRCAVDAAK